MESWLAEVKEKRHMPPEVVGEAECNLVAATGAIEASSDDTRTFEPFEVVGLIFHRSELVEACSSKALVKGLKALLHVLSTTKTKHPAKHSLWALSQQTLPHAVMDGDIARCCALLLEHMQLPVTHQSLTAATRSPVCTVYAVEALQALARNPGLRTHLMEHAAEWGPALWRLLLAEPEGPAYWEVRQQRACCTIRRTALACLKEVESLLCGEGTRLISARPRVHAHLLSDMRGAHGQAAPAQTPHLLRTPQTAGRPPPGQGLDLGTTPGRSGKHSAGHSGMVKRLIRMFKGEHPAEVLEATVLDAEAQPGLPVEAVTWRRQAALEALAPLIRLLGGKAFSSTGIHQPLLNEVFTPVFAGGSLEEYTVTMEAWRAIISAFTADQQLAEKKRIRTTVLNPILYTIGNHGIDKARVALRSWEHLIRSYLPHSEAPALLKLSPAEEQVDTDFIQPVIKLMSFLSRAADQKDGSSKPHSGRADRCQLLTEAIFIVAGLCRPAMSDVLAGCLYKEPPAAVGPGHSADVWHEEVLPTLLGFLQKHLEMTIEISQGPTGLPVGAKGLWERVIRLTLKAARPNGYSWEAVVSFWMRLGPEPEQHFRPAGDKLTQAGVWLNWRCEMIGVMVSAWKDMDQSIGRDGTLSTQFVLLGVSTGSVLGNLGFKEPCQVVEALLQCWLPYFLVASPERVPLASCAFSQLLDTLHEAYSVEPDVLRRQAILCIRLLKLGTDLAAEPLRVHIVQAAKHSMQGACAALQQLCGLASSALRVQWLVFERLAGTLRSSWDRQAEVAEEVINATLCIPKLVARLAVSEASLQRLHGSPGDAQTEAAQLGSRAIPRPAQAGLPNAIESGQKSPASDSPGKQRHAVLCRCARPCDWEQCQIEQILGLSCPAVSTLAGWTKCFELLDAMLARITGPPTSEGESCAQRCASMAESLRGTLKGLPVSTLGAATTCLVAKISTVLANRTVYQDEQEAILKQHSVSAAQRRRERLEVFRLTGNAMDALGPHAEGGECRVVQKAAADCLEGMSSFTKQDYAGMKAMEVLKVFSSLARLAALTDGGMEAALGRCWQGMLAAMAEQDQPGHSLAAALRQKGALVQDLLHSLETGLQHGSAAVRSACYTFWHTPSVQCTLGRHLPEVPEHIQKALQQAQAMGVESQGQSQQQQQHILLPSCVLKQQQYCSGKGADKASGQVAQKGIAASANALPAQAKAPSTGINPAADAEGTNASAAATLAGPQGGQSAAAAAPAAADGAPIPHQLWASVRKRSKRGRVDEDSQTEYVVIPPKAKKRSRDLLTDHQREVAQRQRQGPAREGVVTYTKLDASQGPWSVRPSMQSVPDSDLSGSHPGGAAPDQGAPASQGSAGVNLPQSSSQRAATLKNAGGAQARSQPLKPAGASVSNACAGKHHQEDVAFLVSSPWRVKRRKENSAPSSPEQLAKHARQGLFASTPASSSLGQRAAGQHDSQPTHQDHAFSQEAAAAGKSIMAAIRAAGISPRFSDAPRSSCALPVSDIAASPGGTAPVASLSAVPGAEPASSGKAVAHRDSGASNSKSQPPDALGKASSDRGREAPTREHSQAPREPPEREALDSGRCAGQQHTEAQESIMPGNAEQVDGLSDGDEHPEAQHAPAAHDMDQDMEVDVVGLPVTVPAPAAAELAKRGVPSSARPAHSPGQAVAAGAPAAALHQEAPETVTEGAAALLARQAASVLCVQDCPSSVQNPVNPAADELRTEEPARGTDSAEGASLQDDRAVSLSRGDAVAEACASAVLTVPEQPLSLPEQHASAAAAAGSRAAARPGAVLGASLPAPVQQRRVGSARDPSPLAFQSSLVCTEVQAVPSTLVEAALPPPLAATAHPAGTAAAPAVHASESDRLSGLPHPQHCHPAGLKKSPPHSQQVVPDSAEVDAIVHITLTCSQHPSVPEKDKVPVLPPTALEVQELEVLSLPQRVCAATPASTPDQPASRGLPGLDTATGGLCKAAQILSPLEDAVHQLQAARDTARSVACKEWDEKTRRKVLLAVLSRQQEVVQTLADIQLELHR